MFNGTFGIWFKSVSPGVILGQTGGGSPASDLRSGWVPALYIDENGYLRASFCFNNPQQIVSSTTYNDNKWHHAVMRFDTNEPTNTVGSYGEVSSVTSGVETPYVDVLWVKGKKSRFSRWLIEQPRRPVSLRRRLIGDLGAARLANPRLVA